MSREGVISKISGPVIQAKKMRGSHMGDVVKVGKEKLIGEIIRLNEDNATIQVYEETTGIMPGEPVLDTGTPLSVELGPGLLKSIYDGIQRPLPLIMHKTGDFVSRGVDIPALDRKRKWSFDPLIKSGTKVEGGDIIGELEETTLVTHRVMIPPNLRGTLSWIAKKGDYTIEEPIAKVGSDGKSEVVTMLQKWPVRKERPFFKKLDPTIPLLTGQRVFDTFFPLARGGAAAIPGGFGTGKTVSEHQLAKWSDAKIVVYIGCGERGNEMTDVLKEFPALKDPETGESLMNRTILIANTSNMPVAAREASIYTGITLAEYYRDMGYDVAVMADSTSRWAEALREISGRLEEMPGEEGYPAYLGSRLAEFYERAGRIKTIGKGSREGSISIVGAVSPPGGDFSEPVTQNTLRIVKVFWALDTDLADRRHFPSVNWLRSYSLYLDEVRSFREKGIGKDWYALRREGTKLLEKEAELQEIVRLVGPDALMPKDRIVLEGARMIREDFLQQSAFHLVDTYCPESKQYELLRIILDFYAFMKKAVEKGIRVEELLESKSKEQIARLKTVPNEEFEERFKEVRERIKAEEKKLGAG
ncbi:MAG TPA: V-type ATP synthase subunit A [Thermoplasmata archaeon]|nr:V-type ATP synthase subunit A [Thermoplasmata archaeon]